SNEASGETQQESNKANRETQQELSRAKRLKSAMNNIKGTQNNSVKHNQTNNLHTQVEDYTEDQFSKKTENVQQDAEIYKSSSSS
ncbi:27102_t:CDS:2, partial [Gigaspora margarita]